MQTKFKLKRSLLTVFSLLATTWLALFLYLQGPPSIPGEETTRDLPLDVAKIESHVRFLSAIEPNRSYTHEESMLKAKNYIATQFKDSGYEVRLQEVVAGNGKTYYNVVARYGPANASEVLVLGAHYDVAGRTNPGADDNASGVAGLLEIARLLKQVRPAFKLPVELVAYTLEEPPFFAGEDMGSFVHARSLKDENLTVRLMISLEMIGYFSDSLFSQAYPIPILYALYPWAGNFIGVIGRPADRSVSASFLRAMAANSSVPVRLMNAPSIVQGIDFSDHRNYWLHSWPAVMVTDTAFFRNDQYHKPGDIPDRLDFNKMAQVIRGVYAAIEHIADED